MPEDTKTDIDQPITESVEQDAQKEFTPPADEFDEFLTKMKGEIASEVVQRNANFQWARAYYQMYRGMIGRPNPDLPYEGSSDIRYRKGCEALRQTRPDFVNVILKAPRITRITPYKSQFNDSADRLEGYYETLYRGEMHDCFPDSVKLSYSKAGIEGRVVVKIVWRAETRLMTEDRSREVFESAITQAQKAKYARVLGPILLAQQQQTQQGQQPGQPPQQPQQPQQPQLTPEQIKSAEIDRDDMKEIVMGVMGWDDDDIEDSEDRVNSIIDQLEDTDNDTIEVVVEKVIHNGPWTAVCNYEDIVVPSDSGRIRTAEWICHKQRFTDRQLEAKSISNGGNYRNVEEILELYSSAPLDTEQRQMDSTRRKSEGLGEVKERKDSINVWELYCWVKRSWIKKFNGKTQRGPDLRVKAVITFCPQMGEKANDDKLDKPICLRVMELPYNHGMWPFEDYFYNYTEDRFYEGEGIIGLGWPLEMAFNMGANAATNRNSLAMSPPGFYDEDSGFDPSTVRQFGQMHPIDSTSYVATQGAPAKFMDYPNLAGIPDFDAQKADARFNKMIGIYDPSTLGTMQGPPTAEHVISSMSPSQKVQGYELDNFLDFWGRIFTHVHELCKQYLFIDNPDKKMEYMNRDTGQPAMLTQADFEPKYTIASGGDATAIGGQMQADQKRVFVMQTAFQNPVVAAFTNIYDAWQAFVHKMLSYNEAAAFIPPREKAQQMQQMFMQMQAQAMAKLASGKRPQRQQKTRQLQNAASGLQAK